MANDGVYAGYIVTPSLGMAGHITGIFWNHFWQHFECYLVGTCWAHVEITVWMYPKCDWWIHWGKNDPEPRIYPRCSHWFSGHLAPSENGVAERMNQTLLGGARAMMQHSGMSKGFWAEAMGTAAHILNRAPRRGLNWRTPFELLFGRVPNVSYIQIFGCRAWVLNDQGKKWDPKALPMIFVGYEIGSKAYRLWNPKTKTIVVSANVRFDESMFPNQACRHCPFIGPRSPCRILLQASPS